MTGLLDKAITAARNLPPEEQDAIARMVRSYAGEENHAEDVVGFILAHARDFSQIERPRAARERLVYLMGF